MRKLNAGKDFVWVSLLERGEGPRYMQIADLIAQAIHTGNLVYGDKLPTQRDMAAHLGVDLTTVTRGYNEARRRGLIASFTGKGSYVLEPAQKNEPKRIDLSMNIPPLLADSALALHIQEGLKEVLMRHSINDLSTYQNDYTNRSGTHAAQVWLRPALGDIVDQRILVCAGTQAAIFSVLMTETTPGQTVLCEPQTYPGFLTAAQRLGLRTRGVPEDAEGILPDELERLATQTGATVLYLNPTLTNPTTRTMSAARRKDIASVLKRLGMVLIEDDPYRYLLNDVPDPIATFTEGERTYYLASLSKSVWPSLRVSFVVLPKGDQGEKLQQNLQVSSMGCSALFVSLTEHWIRSGIAKHIGTEIQREARARQLLARSILPDTIEANPTGIHIWLPLPAGKDPYLFTHLVERQGILVASGTVFAADTLTAPYAIRISIGGAKDQGVLGQALHQLMSVFNEASHFRQKAIV